MPFSIVCQNHGFYYIFSFFLKTEQFLIVKKPKKNIEIAEIIFVYYFESIAIEEWSKFIRWYLVF